MNKQRTTYALGALSMGFFVFTLFVVGPTLFASTIQHKNVAQVSHVLAPNAFSNLTLVAQSAIVYDTQSRSVLFEKNASLPLPLASITKIASALVIQDALQNTDTITIPDSALRTEGESGLLAHEHWNTTDLLAFSLVTSSNDGIEALAQIAEQKTSISPVQQMNRYARDAGWNSFHFENVTGLDIEDSHGTPERAGAVGSAHDVALLYEQALTRFPTVYEATAQTEHLYTSLSGIPHRAENTNNAIGDIPGLVAGKTGFTDLAGGNLVVAFEPEPGRRIIIVVLGSTAQERFSDVTTLVNRSLTYVWFNH